MLSKKAYRELVRQAIRENVASRPHCCLVPTVRSDEDGLLYIHFSCLNHDATWRDYIDAEADTGPSVDSRCPSRSEVDAQPDPAWIEETPEEQGPPVTAGGPRENNENELSSEPVPPADGS